MKRTRYAALIALCLFTSSYADDTNETEGAQNYDWQTCVNTKTNDCVNNACLTSSDRDCTDNCKSTAEDKCQSEGLEDPQDN